MAGGWCGGHAAGRITGRGEAVLLRDVMAALDVVGEVNDCVGLKQRRRGLSGGQFAAAMAESSEAQGDLPR